MFFGFSLSLSAALLLPQAVLVAGGVGTSCLPSSSEPLRGVSVFYSEEPRFQLTLRVLKPRLVKVTKVIKSWASTNASAAG
jgi:hypothetical protein